MLKDCEIQSVAVHIEQFPYDSGCSDNLDTIGLRTIDSSHKALTVTA